MLLLCFYLLTLAALIKGLLKGIKKSQSKEVLLPSLCLSGGGCGGMAAGQPGAGRDAGLSV